MLKGFRIPRKTFDKNITLDNIPVETPSIINFKSSEGQRLLQGSKPSPFLRRLCQLIYLFEKKKNKKNLFDFTQCQKNLVEFVESAEELTQNQEASLAGYKIVKICVYILAITQKNCEYLHEFNPLRARVNTLLSAMAHRLCHATGNVKIPEGTKKTKRVPVHKTRTYRLSALLSVILSRHQDVSTDYQQGDQSNNPWKRIDDVILRTFNVSTLENNLEDEKLHLAGLFATMTNVLSKFAHDCATAANEFYCGSDKDNPVTPLLVKDYVVGNRKSDRREEIKVHSYLKSKEWGVASNFLLLEWQKFRGGVGPYVSTTHFQEHDESFQDMSSLIHEWRKFIEYLKLSEEPKKFNTGLLLNKHFIINKTYKPEVVNVLVELSKIEECDDVLITLEKEAMEKHLAKKYIDTQ